MLPRKQSTIVPFPEYGGFNPQTATFQPGMPPAREAVAVNVRKVLVYELVC